jgi:DNA ligase (NAD+)
LKEAKIEELEKIEGIGPIVAKSITEFFGSNKNQKIIKNLLKFVVLKNEKMQVKNFENKTFVLTGTLSNMSRDEAKQKIRSLGGNISSSVSKETDYVVAGENPGNKYEKATELGVKILSEAEFQNLLKI